MDNYIPNAFVFSSKYRVLRHVAFWLSHIIFFAIVWNGKEGSVLKFLFVGSLWVPALMLYCYPLMYWVLPQFLLRGKIKKFVSIMLLWIIAGWFLNAGFRAFISIPLQEYMQLKTISRSPWQQGSFLAMTTTAGVTCMIVLFKYWAKKQQDWLQAEKEKVTVELQLLKAQVHPHFLFNTLNNIYSFALESSPKTPELILKLSSLLSYMLYDCKAEEVLLEKEIEIMKNYIDLEKERYGNKIEISVNIEGEIKDKYIAPLLLLPFLENAFKHGTSEQLEKPWLSVDVSVKKFTMKCKIVNSKNNNVLMNENGIGIQNIKKRLELLYKDDYELKMSDEEDFFVVSLLLELKQNETFQPATSVVSFNNPEKVLL